MSGRLDGNPSWWKAQPLSEHALRLVEHYNALIDGWIADRTFPEHLALDIYTAMRDYGRKRKSGLDLAQEARERRAVEERRSQEWRAHLAKLGCLKTAQDEASDLKEWRQAMREQHRRSKPNLSDLIAMCHEGSAR